MDTLCLMGNLEIGVDIVIIKIKMFFNNKGIFFFIYVVCMLNCYLNVFNFIG